MINALAAHLFMISEEDVNRELTSEEASVMLKEAEIFYDASHELISALSSYKIDDNMLSTDFKSVDKEVFAIFCDVGKNHYDPKKLGVFFSQIYMLLFHTKMGARLPTFFLLIGKEAFINKYLSRLNNPLDIPV